MASFGGSSATVVTAALAGMSWHEHIGMRRAQSPMVSALVVWILLCVEGAGKDGRTDGKLGL